MDHLCFLCFAYLMPLRLFFAALWSPAWKGLTSWTLLLMLIVFLLLFYVVSYLIESFPDLCLLFYFNFDTAF